MKRETLISYFGKKCSPSEAAIVEQWLMDPQNQAEFEQFLQTYWDEHVDEQTQQQGAAILPGKKPKALRYYLPRVAAVAAVLVAVVFYVANTGKSVDHKPTIAAVDVKPAPAGSSADTLRVLPKGVEVKKSKTKQYGKTNLPKKSVAPDAPIAINTDTTAKPPELPAPPRSMKMSAINKVMLNDSALSKLSPEDRIKVLNKLALNVSFNNANFRDVAIALRDKYGIVLELCADVTPDKVLKGYTGSYSNITFPDLIKDMSSQMSFSYTVSNNVVKVCFN